MTQAEKASAYDEMVQRVKELHESGNALTKKQMEIVLPELAESEDERIRKELVHYILYKAKDVSEEQEHAWIAYLEKQKINIEGDFGRGYNCGYEACLHSHGAEWFEKQKETSPISDKFSGLKSIMLQYLQSAANRKDDAEIEDDTDLWGRKILDYVWKYDEKQKEPHYTKRNALFDKCVENCDPEVMKRISDEIDAKLQKEQNPEEWSDEDYNALNYVHELISFGYSENFFDAQTAADMRTWLNSHITLCKPAEWSEEDEKQIQQIERIVKYAECSKALQEKIHNWFKSLRPSWKPSEEQMRVFLKATPVNLMPEELSIYKSLCNDIQKLM